MFGTGTCSLWNVNTEICLLLTVAVPNGHRNSRPIEPVTGSPGQNVYGGFNPFTAKEYVLCDK